MTEKKGIGNNWIEDFLSLHDLIYEKAAWEWENHIPMANGYLGGALWGDNPMKITLGRYDVWEPRNSVPIDKEKYNYATLRKLVTEGKQEEVWRIFEPGLSAKHTDSKVIYTTKLPIGRAEIGFEGSVKSYRARLSLYNGIATGRIELSKGVVEWQMYVHALRNLIVMDIKLKEGAKLNFFGAKPVQNPQTRKRLKDWGYPDPVSGVDGSYEYWKQILPAGGEYVVMWFKQKADSSQNPKEEHIILYLTVSSSTESDNPVKYASSTLTMAMDKGLNELAKEHTNWWHNYWRRSFITIPDPRLESLYYAEMYKLGCSTRPEGYPISLLGLWTEDDVLPPWSGDYHFDMNVQTTYWPIYTSNRLELGEPLYNMILKNMPKMEKFCKEFYGWDGAMLQCSVEYDNTPVVGWHTAVFWPGNGPWIAHHFWLHYLYSGDKDFLREKAYPVMKKFMSFYAGLLEKDEKGVYHLPFSSSPEWLDNRIEAWGKDTSGDLALMRFLCTALLRSVEILGIKDQDKEKWEDILKNLAPFPVDSSLKGLGDSLEIMAGVPLSASHRHFTHLLAIYPLGILNVEGSEEDRQLIKGSITHWFFRGKGEWGGGSFPWASLICSRVGLGNAAWYNLKEYVDAFIMENTQHVNGDRKKHGLGVYTHQVMTLEGGFTAAAAITEMLLQSWGGVIRVFPSMPDIWFDAGFQNLRAEGAFLVSSRMDDKKVKYIKIKSEVGGTCTVRNPFRNQTCKIIDTVSKETRLLSGSEISFDTIKNGVYFLLPEDSSDDIMDIDSFVPLARKDEDKNPFGIKLRPKW